MPVKRVAPKRRLTDVEKTVARLAKTRVLVGIPSSAGMYLDGKATLALIGYIQEFGDDELHIPARPFLVPGLQDASPQIVKFLRQALEAALRNDNSGVDRALNALGLVCQATVQRKMTEGPFAPLADATLYRRQHRTTPAKSSSTKPLIDTGQLLHSITYTVDKG